MFDNVLDVRSVTLAILLVVIGKRGFPQHDTTKLRLVRVRAHQRFDEGLSFVQVEIVVWVAGSCTG